MPDLLCRVILGMCLNCFQWQASDLDKCTSELTAYDNQLLAYEDVILRFEHRVYDSCQKQRLLARREVEACANDSSLMANVTRLVHAANEEQDHYDTVHNEVFTIQVDIHHIRSCVYTMLTRLSVLRNSLVEPEPALPEVTVVAEAIAEDVEPVLYLPTELEISDDMTFGRLTPRALELPAELLDLFDRIE